MKIQRNLPQQLIIADNPWVLALIFGAFMLLGVGYSLNSAATGDWTGAFFALFGAAFITLFMFAFVRRVQAIFNAETNTLTIQRKNLRSARTVTHKLEDVERARLDSTHSKDGDMYRVILIMRGESAGDHPLTVAYSNSGKHKKVMAAINAWLDSYRSAA